MWTFYGDHADWNTSFDWDFFEPKRGTNTHIGEIPSRARTIDFNVIQLADFHKFRNEPTTDKV